MSYLKLAGAVGLALLVGAIVVLWLMLDAEQAKRKGAEDRAVVAEKIAADNAWSLAVLRGQQDGGEAVARKVMSAIAEQQEFSKGQQQRINNAPLNQRNNAVVPGVLADYYDELQRRRAPSAGLPAVGSPDAAGGTDRSLPPRPANAAPQRAPRQRRKAADCGARRADQLGRRLPHRRRRLDGLGRLHEASRQEPGGGLPGARVDHQPTQAARHASAHAAVLIAFLFGVVLLPVIATPSQAQSGQHGAGHAEHHDWYKDKQSPAFSHSCCNAQQTKPDGTVEGDCRPVRAFLADDGIWRAIVDGEPVPVSIPQATIMKEQAPDGNAHLCMSKWRVVYCFWTPQPKA